MLRPLSPQSPSPLRFLSPLKFHVQSGSGVCLKDQRPLFLFLVSRISPGGWLLSLHKQGSFYSPHRLLMGSRILTMHPSLLYPLSGDKRPITSTSALSDFWYKRPVQIPFLTMELDCLWEGPKFSSTKDSLTSTPSPLQVCTIHAVVTGYSFSVRPISPGNSGDAPVVSRYPASFLLKQRETQVSSGNILTCKPFPTSLSS